MNTILKSQSGRSMVEMLGVLAIIGVLSVGGIAGYRQAMLQKNLNDIAQGVSLALIEAETYLEQTGELGRDFENYIGNYRIYANTWDFSNEISGSEIVIIVSPGFQKRFVKRFFMTNVFLLKFRNYRMAL